MELLAQSDVARRKIDPEHRNEYGVDFEHVGYESEFAFKRHFGVAPAGYRRSCLRDLYLTKPNQTAEST